MYQSTVVLQIWCSVLKPIKFYSEKCVKMSTGPNPHGTRPLRGEFTGDQWIPRTKGQ